jgi:hypothetical protein
MPVASVFLQIQETKVLSEYVDQSLVVRGRARGGWNGTSKSTLNKNYSEIESTSICVSKKNRLTLNTLYDFLNFVDVVLYQFCSYKIINIYMSDI